MTKDNTRSLKDAMSQFLKEENLEQRLNEKKLILMWNEIMGSPIARRTSRIYIRQKVMYVTLSSAPLKQELTQSKPKILAIIEEKIGKGIIEDIRFL